MNSNDIFTLAGKTYNSRLLVGTGKYKDFQETREAIDASGAEIPRWIRLRLQAYGDDTASIKAFGLDVVTDLCEQLRAGGAPGLHFYAMNQSAATLEICKRLGL